jgi:uncharacterized protein with GYD domain
MPTYIALIDWTQQGIETFKDSPSRADAAAELIEGLGGQMTNIWWTMGGHDLVAVVDAPDDEAVAAFLLAAGSQGNIRTQTLRAFSREEFESIVEKTG